MEQEKKKCYNKYRKVSTHNKKYANIMSILNIWAYSLIGGAYEKRRF